MIRSIPVALSLVLLAGCSQPFSRLNGVLVNPPAADPRAARPGETGKVTVGHEGAARDGVARMPVRKGDSLATAPDGIGVLTLADGFRVIVEPGTDLTIENPSIFLRIGRVIIRKLEKVREALTVKTTFSAAVVQGTTFAVDADGKGQMRVTVLEGEVHVGPRTGARWRDSTILRAAERSAADQVTLTRLAPLDSAAARALRRRIAVIEGAVPPLPPGRPLWQKPGFFVPALAAVGVGAWLVVRGSSSHPGTVSVTIPF